MDPRALTALALSLVVFAAGPLVFALSRRFRALLSGIHGFVVGSVAPLVVFFVVPGAVDVAGGWALVASGCGLALLTLMERVSHVRPERVHNIGSVLALVGLLLHTLLDGLAVHEGAEGNLALLAAVVLHRLPVAITVWWLVRPAFGRSAAWGVLALAALFTSLGFLLGEGPLEVLDSEGAALFSAFVGGALLHVVLHGATEHASLKKRGPKVAETAGAALGALVVVGVGATGHHVAASLLGYGERFLHLALETAPALLLGYLLAGVVAVYLPHARLGWLTRGSGLSQAARGAAFGIPLPICSCGVLPLYRSLVAKGAPPTAAMAFLVATPELGVESILLSFPLLGVKLGVLRVLCAVVCALGVGWLVGRTVRALAAASSSDDEVERPPARKVKAALRYGFVEVVQDTAAWILVGLAIAAAIDEASLSSVLGALPPGVDVLLAALIGVPLYVCASGATPLVAALLLVGLSPGAAIAFLLAGPATNVTTFGVLSRLHGRAVAFRFALGVVLASVVLGYGVNALLSGGSFAPPVWDASEAHRPLAWLALACVAAAFGYTLLCQGPTGFFSTVVRFEKDEREGEGHGGHDGDGHAEASCCKASCSG